VMMFHATAACIRSDIVSEEKKRPLVARRLRLAVAAMILLFTLFSDSTPLSEPHSSSILPHSYSPLCYTSFLHLLLFPFLLVFISLIVFLSFQH
jgi:hypothetical protein